MVSKFQFHTSVLLIKYLNSHHITLRPTGRVLSCRRCCVLPVFRFLLVVYPCFDYHRFAIPCSAHRTSETILCLRVTAPTRCDRHDRWFQIFFIFTHIWGRFPFWLIFSRWAGTTNQSRITTENKQHGPWWKWMNIRSFYNSTFHAKWWIPWLFCFLLPWSNMIMTFLQIFEWCTWAIVHEPKILFKFAE